MKHIHAELMVQYAQDAMETDKPHKLWQHKINSDTDWHDCEVTPMWTSGDTYRRKPQTKVVDMQELIESGIDCEFSNNGNAWGVGKLVCIKEPSSEEIEDGCVHPYIYYKNNAGLHTKPHRYCRPRMNHVHAWQGGECPLPEGVMVKVWFMGGGVSQTPLIATLIATTLKWGGDLCAGHDIIAFEVVGLADGYCWPWECE